MRSTSGPRIVFPSAAGSPPIWAQAGVCGEEESCHSDSGAGEHGLSQDSGPLLRTPPGEVPGSNNTTSALTSVGHPHLALTPVRGTTGTSGTQLRAGPKLCNGLTGSCGRGDTECQGKRQSMDTSEAPGPGWDAACSEGPGGIEAGGSVAPEKSGSSGGLGSAPQAPTAPALPQDSFTSHFSFIQLSLGAAQERGEAEGCPPARDAEAPAANWARSPGDPALLSLSFSVGKTQGPADSGPAALGKPRQECGSLALSHADIAPACSPHPSRLEGSVSGDTHHWNTLLSKCQSLLLDCLLSDQRQLEVSVSPANVR